MTIGLLLSNSFFEAFNLSFINSFTHPKNIYIAVSVIPYNLCVAHDKH